MLSIHEVSKSYEGKSGPTKVLRGVSMEVKRGEFCVMLGSSGAGKSTLLKLISGQLAADEGQIIVDGTVLTKSNCRQLQRQIGMVHQHFELVERLTCLDNLMLGLLPWVPWYRSVFRYWTNQERTMACQWLARVGLEPSHALRRSGKLSGGQQQRVAIARALIRKPKLVLADEPVASLDPETSHSILTLLRGVARECNATVLCSLHQPDLAHEFADRIIHLTSGVIKFDGPVADWSGKSTYRDLTTTQSN
ncbi:Glutamine transport ATP-binding protein GlnQ [Bremerella volcania]|uniref:Glutamine transport ATP-binding protein GlnQ n=1 Tax=Bremerella volcania TaxID=2527984 RepID=A0A518CC65_9BACT|nr:phosphonate ABC transporter ATP-binding protein [Bremerella volcania]QDU76815.1 Glutamine transport ATP-binding protein GlnQ [Bremerella volcania]